MHQASSRVYYSCECKLRGWVPSPVYNVRALPPSARPLVSPALSGTAPLLSRCHGPSSPRRC